MDCDDENVLDNLEELSIILSEHSKETFWLDSSDAPRCQLEHLAKSIFLEHTQSLRNVLSCEESSNSKEASKGGGKMSQKNSFFDTLSSGCEWWVQVKKLNDDTSSRNSQKASNVRNRSGCCENHDDSNNHNNHNHNHSHNHSQIHGSDNHNHDDNYNNINYNNNKSDFNHNHERNDDCKTENIVTDIQKNDYSIIHDCNKNKTKIQIETGTEIEIRSGSGFGKDIADCTINMKSNPESSSGSVCLHFDKDEEISSIFSVGIFPQLSTVTYLSKTKNTAPTVILERYPKDPVAQSIKKCYVSYPQRGKHVRFDGLYLHGACSQFLDNEKNDEELSIENEENIDADADLNIDDNGIIDISKLSLTFSEYENIKPKNEHSFNKNKNKIKNKKVKYRVTFLVNIWINHKPLKVENLSNKICEKLLQKEKEMNVEKDILNNILIIKNDDNCTKICTLNINEDVISKELNGSWVDIPFVTSDSDWGKEDCETDLFLRIWAPSQIFLEKNIKKMFAPNICKTKKKVSRSGSVNGKKLLNSDHNNSKLKLKCEVEEKENENEESVSTFEINYLDEECFAFLMYDDDDMYGEDEEDDEEDEEGAGGKVESEEDEDENEKKVICENVKEEKRRK